MKNKKYLQIGIAVMLSGVLLFAVALTGNAANNGYEQLKMLLREEPVQMNNMTVHMDMKLSDNGTAVLQAAGDVKADKTAKKMSGQFQVSGKAGEKAIEVYKNGDAALFRLAGSTNWYQVTSPESGAGDNEKFNSRFEGDVTKGDTQVREAFMDTLMGNLKDQVELEESNGLRTFSLSLDKGNMPVLVQTVFSAASMHKEANAPETCDLTNLPAELQNTFGDMKEYKNLVNLSGDRVLEKIKVSLTVDQKNQPQVMEFSAAFSGTAKDGTAHTYDLNCKMSLSDLNTTIPDEAKADPSSVTKIDTTQFDNTRNFNGMHR